MIGRAQPLRALLDLVETARTRTAGEPAVALVSGEPGVGKTRLLAEFTRRLADDVVVLAAQAQPGSLGQPYEVVDALLGGDPHTHTDGDDVRRAADRTAQAVLDRVGPGAGVVIVEDLHWADAGSAAVLARLVTAARPDLVVVISYRPDEITQRLPGGELLARLERGHQVTRLPLEPLRRVEIAAFLAAVYTRQLPSAVVDTLLARTGGNPFFLEELLYAAGSVDPERLAEQPLPWSLADLVAQQLEGLTPDERRLAEAAAVLGARGAFDTLQDLTGLDEASLIACLRALVHRGLLVEPEEDDFTFRHALVRDAVMHQLLGRERRQLHAAALAALRAACCTDLADLARHAAGAGLWDEMVDLARQGVPYYLARGSSHQALRLASDALAEAPDDCELLAFAARAAWMVGFNVEALGHAEHWYAVARRTGSLDQEAAAGRLLARLYHEQGDGRLAPLVTRLEGLVDELPRGVERARLLAALAQIEMLAERTAGAVRWGEAAIAEAELADAKDVRAQAKVEVGSALAHDPTRVADGERILREGIEEAEAIGDLVLVARGLNNLLQYLPIGDPSVPELIAGVMAATERAGFDRFFNDDCGRRLVEHAFVVADRDLAEVELDRLVELVQSSGARRHEGIEPLVALLRAEVGDLDLARELVATAHDAPTQGHWHDWFEPELAALTGDPGPALAAVARVGAEPAVATLAHNRDQFHLWAHAALAAGAHVDDVAAAAGRALDDPDPAVRQALLGLRAELAAARGDHAGVVTLLADPYAPGHDQPGEVRARARLRLLLARALDALGRRDEALAVARAGQRDLARWPGVRADELTRLVDRLTPAEPDTELSRRELEVAALVAEGLTNAELARRLYISPKTAAVHVSNILMKLGLSNRTEVAAWYLRQAAATDAVG